ncbi:MAG TPA: metallophosphoesterase family protein [Candidatus Binataceae bacterium]|nr:metallophosphoesterase family protein [Candidatus Binataceae bacterium]
MRICIISDLHANLEALLALPQDFDQLWVLGDLVNYGPNPKEVIDFVRAHASTVIRGNHDHSVGFGTDCGCSPRFRAMAEATRDYTASVLSAADKQYLRDLPTSVSRQINGEVCFLCHATPSDLLYEYRPPDSQLWAREEEASSDANIILAGHTHLQFSRTVGERLIVNPGSLGQSKMGDPRARYAIWQEGKIELHALEYPVERTAAKISALDLPAEIKTDLTAVLRTGSVPGRSS